MTRRQMLALLPSGALAAALLLTGCGSHDGASRDPGATSPAPAASDLAHMRKLVDDAESAASTAESDAASDS